MAIVIFVFAGVLINNNSTKSGENGKILGGSIGGGLGFVFLCCIILYAIIVKVVSCNLYYCS